MSAPFGEDDLRAQLALEGQLDGWQVYRARVARWVAPIGDLERKVEVPAGWYWAAHWHPDEPPAVAATLAELELLVGQRTPPDEPGRSVIREDPADLDAIDSQCDAVTDEHVQERLQELLADPPERSVMRELLTDPELRHLEISEGRFFLPGPPP